MSPESSPFRPGHLAPLDVFVGRQEGVDNLLAMSRASANGQFQIGFVSGERGIGKSSLAAFVRRMVERQHNAVGCHLFLGGVQNLQELIHRILRYLLDDSLSKPWHQKLLDLFGTRVKEVNLFGVTLEFTDTDLMAMEQTFVRSMGSILDTLTQDKASLFLVLDDINGLASSTEFANWLKSIVDEIGSVQRPMNLCVLIVGLEDRRYELIRHQPSLDRVFKLIDIEPWSEEEVSDFFGKSFGRGGAEISSKIMELLVRYTGGLPVLAHEIGDAVWRTARSTAIQESEAVEGIVIAAELIGGKFLEPQIFRAIRSERYHSILRSIADRPGAMSFTRSEIVQRLSDDDKKAFNNFLSRMRKLGAIEADPETRGKYNFPNHLQQLYFFMHSFKGTRRRT